MDIIRQLRQLADMTQQELAKRARTSQSTIAAYESGSKSPTLRTLVRIARAAEMELDWVISPALTREDRRSLAYHRVVAEKLLRNPAEIVAHASSNLDRLISMHPNARALLDQWQVWLSLRPDCLAELLTAHHETAREMRQVSPFSGVLSPAERTRILRQFREDWAA
jgi:transcriptional regulator with XRE-family HTH domain